MVGRKRRRRKKTVRKLFSQYWAFSFSSFFFSFFFVGDIYVYE